MEDKTADMKARRKIKVSMMTCEIGNLGLTELDFWASWRALHETLVERVRPAPGVLVSRELEGGGYRITGASPAAIHRPKGNNGGRCRGSLVQGLSRDQAPRLRFCRPSSTPLRPAFSVDEMGPFLFQPFSCVCFVRRSCLGYSNSLAFGQSARGVGVGRPGVPVGKRFRALEHCVAANELTQLG